MTAPMKTLNLRIPAAEHEKMKAVAASECMSLTSYIRKHFTLAARELGLDKPPVRHAQPQVISRRAVEPAHEPVQPWTPEQLHARNQAIAALRANGAIKPNVPPAEMDSGARIDALFDGLDENGESIPEGFDPETGEFTA